MQGSQKIGASRHDSTPVISARTECVYIIAGVGDKIGPWPTSDSTPLSELSL